MQINVRRDPFEVITTLIRDIARDEKSFADAFLDLGKEIRDIVQPMDGDDLFGMKEEIAAVVPFIKARGFEQNAILPPLEQRIILCGKRSERNWQLNDVN